MRRHAQPALSLCLLLGLTACVDTDVDTEPTYSIEGIPAPDNDGDGYAGPTDCDDADATRHPRAPERSNGLDDDCDRTVDEPVLSYRRVRPAETQTYAQVPKLRLQINDLATIRYLDTHASVSYSLTYQRLSNGSSPDLFVTGQLASVSTPLTWGTELMAGTGILQRVLTLDPNAPTRGLVARQIYRMKVQLLEFGRPLGPSSEWMYVPTAGTTASLNTALQWWRIDLALLAFQQYADSEAGLVGALGTVAPDGQRYTASNLTPLHRRYDTVDDLAWCDWFYHWLGATVSDGVDGNLAANVVVDGGTTFWHGMNPDSVPNAFRDTADDGCGWEIGDVDHDGQVGEHVMHGCQDYADNLIDLDTDDLEFFSNVPGNVYYDQTASLPANQGIGNYQAMDEHAGMFLAFDPGGDGTFAGAGSSGTVWSIEGNIDNEVAIMTRPGDSTFINGFGKLRLSLFQ